MTTIPAPHRFFDRSPKPQCSRCIHGIPQPRIYAHLGLTCRQVVGVSKLRTKYESHEAKRILAGAYDLFVADERVIPSLPKLLGARRTMVVPCVTLNPSPDLKPNPNP